MLSSVIIYDLLSGYLLTVLTNTHIWVVVAAVQIPAVSLVVAKAMAVVAQVVVTE